MSAIEKEIKTINKRLILLAKTRQYRILFVVAIALLLFLALMVSSILNFSWVLIIALGLFLLVSLLMLVSVNKIMDDYEYIIGNLKR